MHLAYCLHVVLPLGTRLLHDKKCGKGGTVEEEIGRMSNTAITGLTFQWVLLTWRFVSSGQTVNKRRTQPMKKQGHRRNVESATDPDTEPKTQTQP